MTQGDLQTIIHASPFLSHDGAPSIGDWLTQPPRAMCTVLYLLYWMSSSTRMYCTGVQFHLAEASEKKETCIARSPPDSLGTCKSPPPNIRQLYLHAPLTHCRPPSFPSERSAGWFVPRHSSDRRAPNPFQQACLALLSVATVGGWFRSVGSVWMIRPRSILAGVDERPSPLGAPSFSPQAKINTLLSFCLTLHPPPPSFASPLFFPCSDLINPSKRSLI